MSTGVSSATLPRSQRRTKSSLLRWTIESVKKLGCHRAGGTVHQKTTFALAIENFFSRATTSVNQVSDVDAGVDTFGKKLDSTANIVWQNFLGVVNLL